MALRTRHPPGTACPGARDDRDRVYAQIDRKGFVGRVGSSVAWVNNKGPRGSLLPGLSLSTFDFPLTAKLVHSAHSTAVSARHRRFLLFFRKLAHERFSGEEQRGDR